MGERILPYGNCDSEGRCYYCGKPWSSKHRFRCGPRNQRQPDDDDNLNENEQQFEARQDVGVDKYRESNHREGLTERNTEWPDVQCDPELQREFDEAEAKRWKPPKGKKPRGTP